MPSIDCHSPIPFPACQKFELNSENKALIRAIILSKGREGCSMSDIKRKIYKILKIFDINLYFY